MNKTILDLANKVAENKDTLVAAFMLAYPDVPIEDILLVQSTTDTGFTISVQETWERATHLTSAEGKALAFRNKKLSERVEKLEEFVKDCSVSHVESRYKYRAQLLLNKELK